MKTSDCMCGHEKRDHRAVFGGRRHGACKICLCDAYVKSAVVAPSPPQPVSSSAQSCITSPGSLQLLVPVLPARSLSR